jgi:superfamily II DNA helicase RecQ
MDVSSLLLAERSTFEVLRDVRAREATRLNVKRYHVASDAQLCELVRHLPDSIEDIEAVPGIGHIKAHKYGALFIDALRPHVMAIRAAQSEHAAKGLSLGELVGRAADALAALKVARDALAASLFDPSKEYQKKVCSDVVLCEIVKRMPANAAELLKCKGMGPYNVERHGTALLAALEPHLKFLKAQQSATKKPRGRPVAAAIKKRVLSSSFRQGRRRKRRRAASVEESEELESSESERESESEPEGT